MTTEQIWAALKEAASVLGTNTGHGHVWGRPDGLMVRCGGPGVCELCTLDAAMFLPNPETILALEAEHSRLRAENERLRGALEDLVSWFPETPTPARWEIKAGEYGADNAVDAARAALNTDEAHK